jgi:aldehyde dehydrogenase (NAD+)
MTEYKNYINGEWVDSDSGERFENRNPADTNDLIGTFPSSTENDVDKAVAAAKEAYKGWRLVPAPKRAESFWKLADIMVRRKEETSQIMTREMGKVIAETRGDMQEGIDTAFFAAGEGRRLHGHTVPSEMPNKFNMTMRMPMGVFGMICPWNFPMAIPTWKTFPAILCGNTIVIKPASDTPATVSLLAEMFEEAGFPPGVFNVVHGSGSKVGNALTGHKDIAGISFTGSTKVGKIINERAGGELKRVSLELGGKNGQIVMPDANLELAVDGVLWGAFGTTGQRCTATSRLIVHKDVHDKVMEMLIPRVKELKLGNGLDGSIEVGPVVNESQLETMDYYVNVGKNEDKAELVCGGERATGGDLDKGYFFQPTVFDKVTRNMRIAQEEIFGPVLSVITVESFEEAVDVLNDTEYGLSSSIYTQDVNLAYRALRDIECGITYINGPTIGAECHMPFGGFKGTGNGHREGGWEVYEFYTETKTCYVDYSGILQRAQIDNYDE